MFTHRERLPEHTVTEWEGVRIRIVVEHPDAKESMSYEIFHDDRLMPLLKIARPLPEDRFAVLNFEQRMFQRREVIELLSKQIAAAVTHAMQRVDGS